MTIENAAHNGEAQPFHIVVPVWHNCRTVGPFPLVE